MEIICVRGCAGNGTRLRLSPLSGFQGPSIGCLPISSYTAVHFIGLGQIELRGWVASLS